MDWKIEIVKVENGYTVRWEEENNDPIPKTVIKTAVYEERGDADTDLETLTDLTYHVWELLGYYGSKHDKERLWIKKEKKK